MSQLTSLTQLDFTKEIDLPKEEIRELISKFEQEVAKLPQMEIPVFHHFSEGVYAREITFPKGTLIIGMIHKKRNMNILSSGECTVLSVDGITRVKAPFTFVADPGAKRVIFAHEDSVWTTIHGTHERDIEKIESEFIAKSYDEVEGLLQGAIEVKEAKWLGSQSQ